MSIQLQRRRRRDQGHQRRSARQTGRKRVALKPLTPTRATRRSLACAVQRLVAASTRFALAPTGRSRWSHTLALQGWPNAVRLVVRADALALVVTHDGQWCDCLLWPDCQPQQCRGGWRCALCAQAIPPSRVYRRLSDLWFDELAQPLLDYLARVPEQAELQLSALPDGGATWARVVAAGGDEPRGESVVASWPIGAAR
jgi:hypothetical protein